jgi:fumarate reductase subunit D
MADPRTVKRRRSREPILWALFSGGGMLAAMLLPALALLLWIAVPLGWVAPPSYDGLLALARHPLTRLFLFVLVTLAAFHWAHRFRYTLYDGLQLYHLNTLIAVTTYGVASVVSLLAALALICI